ncbi:MAG: DUF4476 domain-containing protein [Chitinophagales bacterium]|nr:DUF4476 domain-containing protein [Chitinophagaceae bacterium]MCB9064475.1 DUF4476 domain-containing protein [Chitinophagales bacterium]
MRSVVTIMALFFATVVSAAEMSVLKVRLTTGEPLAIKIDGRDYQKYARSLTVGDLPRGWHRLNVYEVSEYKKGGGRAKLIYSGKLRLDRGTVTLCEVDPRSGKMRISTQGMEDVYVGDGPREGSGGRAVPDSRMVGITDKEMADLEQEVQQMPTDVNTLKTMKETLAHKSYTTEQAKKMVNWLAFDGSRLDFAKWSYSHVTDKESLSELSDAFSLDSSKEEFKKFLEEQE